MRFLKCIYATSILIAGLCFFWGCNNGDDTNLSKAVLASVSTLDFEGDKTVGQMITIYADSDWVIETPEWITVDPASGSGVMDVVISVSDNIRDGALDNPRKAVVVFKGSSLASRSEVIVIQAGDKYRDVKEYKIDELAALKDETVVSAPELTVMAVTTTGFIAIDEHNTGAVFVLNDSEVEVGDKVSIMGTKITDAQSLIYIDSDKLETISTGGTVTYPAADDITTLVDTYNSDSREFITVDGILTGNNISVRNANILVNITNAPESLGLAALNNHRVTVKGYFAGVAKPVLKIMITEILDGGSAKNTYFSEDFEWLLPWAAASDVGQAVETNIPGATAPQISKSPFNGTQAVDTLIGKGYEFLYVTTTVPAPAVENWIYLQSNYLKFGKTGYQAGIIFPKIGNIPSDVTATLSFNWCPMRQGEKPGHVFDPVNLIVIIENEGAEVIFNIPESGFEAGRKLEWIRAEVVLTGVTITSETKITIRQTQWPAATANRWFLDNIEIFSVTW